MKIKNKKKKSHKSFCANCGAYRVLSKHRLCRVCAKIVSSMLMVAMERRSHAI